MSTLDLMSRAIRVVGILLCAAGPSAFAAPEAAAPAVVVAPASTTPATIEQITDLARQLKVELLRKELREAKNTASGATTPTAVVGALPPGLGVPTSKSTLAAMKMPPVPKPVATPPVVAGIVGSGGSPLKARLLNGRLVATGETVPGFNGGESWMVKAISNSTVAFEQCQVVTTQPDKKAKGTKPSSVIECTTRMMAPASFQ